MEIYELKFNIEVHIAKLNSTLSNLKKAPNRKYQKKTLTEKLKESREDYNFIINNLAEHETKFTHSEISFLTK